MGFLSDRQHMEEAIELTPREMEMNYLAKARGFGAGEYNFEAYRIDMNNSEDSIINGIVKGEYMVPNDDLRENIVFDQEEFSEKAWRGVCSALGFKYHNHKDIEHIYINPESIRLQLSIITPKEDI